MIELNLLFSSDLPLNLKVSYQSPIVRTQLGNGIKKELGVNYYSDDDHKIEHSIKEFYEEMTTSGLK